MKTIIRSLFVIGLIGIAGNINATVIINQLSAKNALAVTHSGIKINKKWIYTEDIRIIQPGQQVRIEAGAKVSLVVDGKPSATDYIEFKTLQSGGDKKYGRLMSVCSVSSSNYLEKCAIKFADQ